jgi:hypothetical protein
MTDKFLHNSCRIKFIFIIIIIIIIINININISLDISVIKASGCRQNDQNSFPGKDRSWVHKLALSAELGRPQLDMDHSKP